MECLALAVSVIYGKNNNQKECDGMASFSSGIDGGKEC
jgi:hypothetical protein